MTWRQGDTCRASTPWWCSRTSRNRCAMLSWREPFWASEILWDASIPGGSETKLLGLKMFFLLHLKHLCDALLLQCCFSRLSIGTQCERCESDTPGLQLHKDDARMELPEPLLVWRAWFETNRRHFHLQTPISWPNREAEFIVDMTLYSIWFSGALCILCIHTRNFWKPHCENSFVHLQSLRSWMAPLFSPNLRLTFHVSMFAQACGQLWPPAMVALLQRYNKGRVSVWVPLRWIISPAFWSKVTCPWCPKVSSWKCWNVYVEWWEDKQKMSNCCCTYYILGLGSLNPWVVDWNCHMAERRYMKCWQIWVA